MNRRVELLEVREVETGHWRICDSRLPDDDPARLLAFAEVAGGSVDVVWFVSGRRRSRYDALDDVLAVCRALLHSRGSERRRPKPISHVAPAPTGGIAIPRRSGGQRG